MSSFEWRMEKYRSKKVKGFVIYYWRLTFFSFLPHSPYEIGTAGISQGKSALISG